MFEVLVVTVQHTELISIELVVLVQCTLSLLAGF